MQKYFFQMNISGFAPFTGEVEAENHAMAIEAAIIEIDRYKKEVMGGVLGEVKEKSLALTLAQWTGRKMRYSNGLEFQVMAINTNDDTIILENQIGAKITRELSLHIDMWRRGLIIID